MTIEVTDRGTGIPAAERERVFQPFFTTKSKGTGIGLTIALNFAEAAGGTLQLVPRRGGGTQARLALPAVEGA